MDEDKIEDAKKKISTVRGKPKMDALIINEPTDSNIELSIIIPAYNVEESIEECLNSILNQNTNYNLELIIVNDGSTDKTKKIIKRFNDSRIKYYEQKNQGLSAARNTGLNHSIGKNVLFVDSDDIICDESIDKMLDALIDNKADVVVGSYYMFTNNNESKQKCILERKVIKNSAKECVKNPGYAWGKIYKRELFNNVRFPVGAWYEDSIITSVIYRMCKKMVVLDDLVYAYRINPNGISKTARSSPKSIDHYWVVEDAIEQAKKNGLENDEVLYQIVLNHMSTFLYRRISLMDEEIIKNVFVLACNLVKEIRPEGCTIKGNFIEKDIELSFEKGNYKLWKLASFVV